MRAIDKEDEVTVTLKLSEREAANFALLVRRLSGRRLDDLDLAEQHQVANFERALFTVRDAFASAGFSAR